LQDLVNNGTITMQASEKLGLQSDIIWLMMTRRRLSQ